MWIKGKQGLLNLDKVDRLYISGEEDKIFKGFVIIAVTEAAKIHIEKHETKRQAENALDEITIGLCEFDLVIDRGGEENE